MSYIELKKRFFKYETGVVMMETILVLPVYIVILAGIFWLGEMCMAQLTLTNGERLRLWEKNNRYPGDLIADTDIFWFLPQERGKNRSEMVTAFDNLQDTFSQTANIITSSNGWSRVRSGNATINSRRSNWSWGIAAFTDSELWNFTTKNSGDIHGAEVLSMYTKDGQKLSLLNSRAEAPGTEYRCKYYMFSDTDDAGEWQRIFLENSANYGYPSYSTPIDRHKRTDRYQNWSL